jgi:hypothetical protein
MVNSCIGGSGSAETCNGIDDDCDGQVDEGFSPVATTCGLGACGAAGQKSCVNGKMVDSCTAGTPQSEGSTDVFGNETCSDQVDNDCDGLTDASDPDCPAALLLNMDLWAGNWFEIKSKVKCKTFGAPGSPGVKEQYVETGYMNIKGWDQDARTLQFDYYYYDKAMSAWETYPGDLHFFAGTNLRFLFWYAYSEELTETILTGEITGKSTKGLFRDDSISHATIKTLGGVYTESQSGYAKHSAGEETMTGKLIAEEDVPVPVSVRKRR